MRLEPITLRFLPPDEHRPDGIPSHVEALLYAFEAKRGDARFSAAWAVGTGEMISNVGQAAMLRACDASKRMAKGEKFNAHIVQVSNRKRGPQKTWRYVRAHLNIAENGDAVIFVCADDKLYDQAAWGILRDPTITLYSNEGMLIPRLERTKLW